MAQHGEQYVDTIADKLLYSSLTSLLASVLVLCQGTGGCMLSYFNVHAVLSQDVLPLVIVPVPPSVFHVHLPVPNVSVWCLGSCLPLYICKLHYSSLPNVVV